MIRLPLLLARSLCLAGALAMTSSSALAELRLAEVFGDHMVLQRDVQTNVWGYGTPGAIVQVSLAGELAIVGVGEDGRFGARLGALPAGGPHQLIAHSNGETVVLDDVLMGDVWVAMGQSNMQWSLLDSQNGPAETAAADHADIRLFSVPRTESEVRLDDLPPADWSVCAPTTAASFSAVAYFFGRELNQTLEVPVGLIMATWDGTPAEVWARRETIAATPGLEPLIDDMPPIDPTRPPRRAGVLYNGMLHPIQPYAIQGTIWYQGESNVDRAQQYRLLFPTVIQDMRTTWQQGTLPFYYVQIAPFEYEAQFGIPAAAAAELREAQLHTLRIGRAGMVVTTDIGTPEDLHPLNKLDVGRRLADWAFLDSYGMPRTTLGPVPERVQFQGTRATVTYRRGGDELYTSDGLEPSDFLLAGEDRVFHPALAQFAANGRIRVTSPMVDRPIALRFAWDDDPQPNLFGPGGLPAVPYRTDDWPGVTE